MTARKLIYGGVAVLALVAYFVSGRSTSSVAQAGNAPRSVIASSDAGGAPQKAGAPLPLPSSLDRPALEPAEHDPFAPWLATPPAKAIASPPPPPVSPPPPTAPPLNLRFAGRMTGPDGSVTVFVMLGETSLPITAGQSLPNGYKVEAITPQFIEFNYPPMNTTTRLELPEPSTVEVR